MGGHYGPLVWAVELDANGVMLTTSSGAAVRHLLQGSLGTSAWSQRTMTFTTDSRCARGYVYAIIYNSYGTAWIDDIRIR